MFGEYHARKSTIKQIRSRRGNMDVTNALFVLRQLAGA